MVTILNDHNSSIKMAIANCSFKDVFRAKRVMTDGYFQPLQGGVFDACHQSGQVLVINNVLQ